MKPVMLMIGLSLAVTLNAATKSEEASRVRSMLTEIEQAQEAKRYEKINAFKLEIKKMNQEVQDDANQKLVKLQERLRVQERTSEGNGEGEQIQNREETRSEKQESLMLKQQEMLNLQQKEQMGTQQKVKKTDIPKQH